MNTRDVVLPDLRRLRFQTVLGSGVAAGLPFVDSVFVEPPKPPDFATSFKREADDPDVPGWVVVEVLLVADSGRAVVFVAPLAAK